MMRRREMEKKVLVVIPVQERHKEKLEKAGKSFIFTGMHRRELNGQMRER